ncbi:response regulator transcription factor [Fusibacter paucivorans]|uniref:Stage 0 sporulation protein A homolog n=1 Tax=Fusibacter paucivorans TaxID=76009 RepID=A0ABS5PV22_9FIRM|nr:response regulator transcription factor [Fusibacter paucivorans]MBS7528304.1 response regulator transcription factor [Fusibacter paucivorans]
MRIIIVDDDQDIGEILKIALQDKGYETVVFNSSELAMAYLSQNAYDMVLLDIMMPSLNGYDLCNHIRKINDVPILFITCLDDDESLTKALALGGDDYIRKPFSISEVMARVGAHLRRYVVNVEKQSNTFECTLGPYVFNANERVVKYQMPFTNEETLIRLSPLESDLLRCFADHPNEVLTYQELYEAIWKEMYHNEKGTIMVRVSSLRSKLPNIDIESVRGQGYRLAVL